MKIKEISKTNFYYKNILCLLIFSLFITSLNLKAQDYEHILNYHSDIRIDTSGRLDITEKLKVLVTGESIKRGIVRTIPLYRKGSDGYDYKIKVQVDSVFRNNVPEKFTTKTENKDLAIYIGDKYITLHPDTYEYTIKYSTPQQIGFFDGYDEIYWNVNGNDWHFDIDSVSASVYLPKGTKLINNACYTGRKGSTANNCSYQSIGDSIVLFQANTSFKPKEGLTIATSFTPNIIKRPPPPIPIDGFMNSIGIKILLGICIVLGIYYYIITVRKINTMNGRQVLIPTFDPPLNMSAAVVNYLEEKEANERTFMACLVSMAVKKSIRIKNEGSVYTLINLRQTTDLSQEELSVYQTMFANGETEVTFGNKKRTLPSKTLSTMETTIKASNKIEDFRPSKDSYFAKFNLATAILLVFWCIILYVSTNLQLNEVMEIGYTTFLLLAYLSLYYIDMKFRLIAFFVLCGTLPTASILIGPRITDTYLYGCTIVFTLFLLILNILFHRNIKPKTKKGVEFFNELKGFKKYLTVAEEDRLNFLTLPDFTPEEFEKMLPYAIALRLEIKWAKKFAKKLPNDNYQPTWYEGKSSGSFVKFTQRLSKSLTSSVNNSVRDLNANGTSYGGSSKWGSGSGGHGSSGRGGGGGGGRGW